MHSNEAPREIYDRGFRILIDPDDEGMWVVCVLDRRGGQRFYGRFEESERMKGVDLAREWVAHEVGKQRFLNRALIMVGIVLAVSGVIWLFQNI